MRETIVPIIANRIPEFIKEDYPKFARFMNDYFRWLETDEKFLRIVDDWKSNLEPSNNVEPYIDSILKDAGWFFDREIKVPKSTLLHMLRDYYLSRGSSQSYEFIFRLLFNEICRIQYPREKMLVPSAAVYGIRHFIYTTTASINDKKFDDIVQNAATLSGVVEGLSSEVKVSIEAITKILGSGSEYLEIEILEPIGEFYVGENVRITVGDNIIYEKTLNVAEIVIENGGHGFKVDDVIEVSGAKVNGWGFIQGTNKGEVTGIQINSPGSGYEVGDLIMARASNNIGAGFTGQVTEVEGDGEIVKAEVVNGGHSYSDIPSIFAKRQTDSLLLDYSTIDDADLTALSSDIGSITKIKFVAPYIDFDPLAVSVSALSDTGENAVLTVKEVSRFTRAESETNLGFLGIASTITDSNIYQQFSYEIISPINPSRYLDVTDPALHPVGYVRSAVIELSRDISIKGAGGSGIEETENKPYIFEHEYPFNPIFELEIYVDDLTINKIITHKQDTIVTSNGDMIIWTEEYDPRMRTGSGDVMVTDTLDDIIVS